MSLTTVVRDSTESPTLTAAPVAQLAAHPDNPRRTLGELAELAKSVAAHGVLEPLLVVPLEAFNAAAGEQDQIGDPGLRWVIVAGHRRHAAAVRAKAASVPVLLRPDLADRTMALEVMVTENYQRSDLTPIEEAHAFAALRGAGRSQRDIAGRLGCAQSHVSKRLALLELPAPVQAAVDGGRLQLADAAELLRLRKHPDELAAVAGELLDLLDDGQSWSPRYVENLLDARLRHIDQAETQRRLLAQAEARGARILTPDQLPPYPLRRPLTDPAVIDAAGQAGTLGAYLGGDGRIVYLDLTPAPTPDADGGRDDDADADGPDVVSGEGITVRRINPAHESEAVGAAARSEVDAARQAAALDREQAEAAEAARDEACQRVVTGFAADPTSVLPFLAGHVLTDTDNTDRDDGWYADPDRAEAWLAAAGLIPGLVAAYESDDQPEIFAWLDRTADPTARTLAAGALALAAAEDRLRLHAGYGGWDVHDLAHLDRLTAAGHTLHGWEQQHADRVHTTCTAAAGCGQPYGHPGDCDDAPASAEVPT